jgi:Arc/MetJ-type ribon-helix-helix transcriptional regulator
MRKTTVYLPDELSAALKRAAAESGRSESELIREGIATVVEATQAPRPRIPLFAPRDGTLAERADELLAEGFGKG